MPLTGITMFRARDDATNLDNLIPDRTKPGHLEFEDFRLSDNSVALVYYRPRPVRPPKWASFFRDIVPEDRFRSASSAAVVVFERENRWYLVTFGYGRYLIDLDMVEPAFGLRVTLNGIDPSRIRAIDRKRVDTVSRITREQLSRDSRIGSFGLNVHQDLLNAVTGVPVDERLGTRLYGKDAVGVRIDIGPQDLGNLADLLEELFQYDSYRERFRWVDNIAEVRGNHENSVLNDELLRMIRDGGTHEIDLAPPDLVDWSQAHGFVYPQGNDPQPELTLQSYLADIQEGADLTEKRMRKDRVQLLDLDGNRLGGWSIFRCVAGEITRDDGVFVISDGKWYRVNREFSDEVARSVEELSQPVVDLPPYQIEDENELAYNERVARQSNGELVCMDQRFIWPRSWQDRIEFCDLYRADRTMIHVKRYSGGSASLSHLFSQGSVSIRCLLHDRSFAGDLDNKLPASHSIGDATPDPESCRVVFAVVAKQGQDFRLPFFSRVALRNSAEVIRNLGVQVSLQSIANDARG